MKQNFFYPIIIGLAFLMLSSTVFAWGTNVYIDNADLNQVMMANWSTHFYVEPDQQVPLVTPRLTTGGPFHIDHIRVNGVPFTIEPNANSCNTETDPWFDHTVTIRITPNMNDKTVHCSIIKS